VRGRAAEPEPRVREACGWRTPPQGRTLRNTKGCGHADEADSRRLGQVRKGGPNTPNEGPGRATTARRRPVCHRRGACHGTDPETKIPQTAGLRGRFPTTGRKGPAPLEPVREASGHALCQGIEEGLVRVHPADRVAGRRRLAGNGLPKGVGLEGGDRTPHLPRGLADRLPAGRLKAGRPRPIGKGRGLLLSGFDAIKKNLSPLFG